MVRFSPRDSIKPLFEKKFLKVLKKMDAFFICRIETSKQ
jgi:hypothetical protein